MKKVIIIIIYLIAFWIILPLILVGGSQMLDGELSFTKIHSNILLTAGIFFILISVPFLVISIVQFKKFGRELPISASPPKKIIRNGVFAVWRHPIYLFYTIFFIGIAFITGSRSMLFIVMPSYTIILFIYVFVEERILIKRFGDTYRSHIRTTPLLIPSFINVLKIPAYLVFKGLFLYRVTGLENIPSVPPFILISSHRNYLDPFLIALSVPFRINFVTTYEMFRKPSLRFILQKLASIPKKRYLHDIQAAKTIIKRIKDEQVIGIFPEGERSWTGSMNSFKPETLNMFKKFYHIPILPVRIEGNYYSWPRWGSKFRKSQVLVAFQPPVHVDPNSTAQALEKQLASLIRPEDRPEDGFACKTENRVNNLPLILYRCPVCYKFDTLIITNAKTMECCQCKESFILDSLYRIQHQSKGREKPDTIEEFYNKIRITTADIFPITDCKPEMKFPELLSDPPVAYSDHIQLFIEVGNRLKPFFQGKMILTTNCICFSSVKNTQIIALAELGAVTIESNFKLQLYVKDRKILFQVIFTQESAKKWQDYILETMRKNEISMPIAR